MSIKVGKTYFVQVRGYPMWPARINALPSQIKLNVGEYPIFFYGTHQIAKVNKGDIFEVNDDNIAKYNNKYSEKKEKAIKEMENDPHILEFGHDEESLTFLKGFYKFDSTVALKEFKDAYEGWNNSYKERPEKKKKSDTNNEENSNKTQKKSTGKRKSENNNQLSNQVLLQVSTVSDNHNTQFPPHKAQDDSSTSDINVSSRKPRRSKTKFMETLPHLTKGLQNELPEKKKSKVRTSVTQSDREEIKYAGSTGSSNVTYKSSDISTEKAIPKTKKEPVHTKRIISPPHPISLTNIFYPKEKENSSESSNENITTRGPQNNQIQNADKVNDNLNWLLIIEQKIKQSLCIGRVNIDNCLEAFNEILSNVHQLTLKDLCISKSIIGTVDKCTRYKNDEFVRLKAREVYKLFMETQRKSTNDQKSKAGEILVRMNKNQGSAADLLDALIPPNVTLTPQSSQGPINTTDICPTPIQSHTNPTNNNTYDSVLNQDDALQDYMVVIDSYYDPDDS